jgi:hypothetical protein
MGRLMDCVKLYLTCAEECLRMSKKARSPDLKDRWFSLAEKWTALAQSLLEISPADQGRGGADWVPATSH